MARRRWSRRPRVLAAIVASVDVLIGNEEDFVAALGLSSPARTGRSTSSSRRPTRRCSRSPRAFPNLKAIAVTLWVARDGQSQRLGCPALVGWVVYPATTRRDLESSIVSAVATLRIGLIYGWLAGHPPQVAVEYGAAHGALAMTTPGDTSMATQAEVEALMAGAGARVRR